MKNACLKQKICEANDDYIYECVANDVDVKSCYCGTKGFNRKSFIELYNGVTLTGPNIEIFQLFEIIKKVPYLAKYRTNNKENINTNDYDFLISFNLNGKVRLFGDDEFMTTSISNNKYNLYVRNKHNKLQAILMVNIDLKDSEPSKLNKYEFTSNDIVIHSDDNDIEYIGNFENCNNTSGILLFEKMIKFVFRRQSTVYVTEYIVGNSIHSIMIDLA